MTVLIKELVLEINREIPRSNHGNIVEHLGERLTFIHGKRDMGKSNLLALIDFCFGGSFPEDQMSREWIEIVQLNLDIAGMPTTIERGSSENKAWVYFTDDQGEQAVQVPVKPGPNPEAIYKSATYLSELLLLLSGFPALKVNITRDGEKNQECVGFRDVLRFTYLDGAHGVQDVFGLRVQGKSIKARQVLRYILGTYSEQRNHLEEQIDAQRSKLRDQRTALSHSRSVLNHFGITGQPDFEAKVERARGEVDRYVAQIAELDRGAIEEQPEVAPLYARAKEVEAQLQDVEESVELLRSRVQDQDRLYNQLTSYIARGAKAAAARPVIETARIVSCPACHLPTPEDETDEETCHVCHRHVPPRQDKQSMQAAILYLRRQREEAANARNRLEILLEQAKRRSDKIRAQKGAIDQQMTGLLDAYETRTAAQRSAINQKLGEARRNLEQLLALKEDVATHERREARLQRIEARIDQLKVALSNELRRDQTALHRRRRLQELIREAWLECGSIGPNDSVEIPDSTLIPQVRPFGLNPAPGGPLPTEVDDFQAVGQATASLRTACLMVAIHRLAVEEELPLPRLMIMDTPTAGGQNEANLDARRAFYRFLWRTLEESLHGHQVIIVAGDPPAVMPPFEFVERHMTPDKSGPNPPLLR